MNIYNTASTKPAPYVYRMNHKVTSEFYIGFRMQNVAKGLTSAEDLPRYKTSSRAVKPRFTEFSWQILAEFPGDPDAAYAFEQQLIFENWGNPSLLNRRHHHGKSAWRNVGCKHSDETRAKMRLAKQNMSEETKAKMRLAAQNMSEETKAKMSLSKQNMSEETKAKMSASAMCRSKPSDETRAKMSTTHLGSKPSDETRAKISAALQGRELSDETKAKMRLAKQNMSKESKKKMSVAHSIPVSYLGVEYASFTDAMKATGHPSRYVHKNAIRRIALVQ